MGNREHTEDRVFNINLGKRGGAAATNSQASNGNNIVLGKRGRAASNSVASNKNNIMIGKEEEEKREWGGAAASNSGASNGNNISLGKRWYWNFSLKTKDLDADRLFKF